MVFSNIGRNPLPVGKNNNRNNTIIIMCIINNNNIVGFYLPPGIRNEGLFTCRNEDSSIVTTNAITTISIKGRWVIYNKIRLRPETLEILMVVYLR